MDTVWIMATYLFGTVVRHLGLPPLVGYLVAGFSLHGLGHEAGSTLNQIAHLGVLLLLFSVGLKVRLKNVIRPEVWGGAFVHLGLLSILVGIGLAIALDLDRTSAWLLAFSLGFSSTVLTAKVLEEKLELRSFHGRVAIGILVIQDLVAIALLGLVVGSLPSATALAALGLPLARPLMHHLLELSGHDELLVLFGLLLAVVVGGGRV